MAVLILSILIAAAARGLLTSLQADESNALLFEGQLLRDRIEASLARSTATNETVSLVPPGWTYREGAIHSNGAGKVSWRIFSLESAKRPSLSLRGAIRED